MTFTTSYKTEGMLDLITSLVKSQNPKLVLEFGTQQGSSAIAIAKGLKDGKLITYDLFEPNYDLKPYGETHANKKLAEDNIKNAGFSDKVEVLIGNVFEIYGNYYKVDIIHIDLCNHFDNVKPILDMWENKVQKMILLEGGYLNHWQKKFNFKSFHEALHLPEIIKNWEHCVIVGDENYSLTVMTRRKYDKPV